MQNLNKRSAENELVLYQLESYLRKHGFKRAFANEGLAVEVPVVTPNGSRYTDTRVITTFKEATNIIDEFS